MKKKYLAFALLSLFALTFPVSCGEKNNSEVITGVEIAGPRTVEVGKSITLVADVLGSEKDEVTWQSQNEDIATVNEDGKVTAIHQGNVEIKAISTQNPDYFATYSIEVTVPMATKLEVYIEEGENISYQEDSNKYFVPFGREFYVSCKESENFRSFDSYSFELKYPASAGATQGIQLEMDGEKRAKVVAFETIKGMAVQVKGYYSNQTDPVITYVNFDVFDANLENKTQMEEKLTNSLEKESQLLSSKVETRYEKGNVVNEETFLHHGFQDVTCVQVKEAKSENQQGTKEENIYFFNGIYEQNYYCFSYDEEGKINQVYQNVDAEKHEQEANLFFRQMSGNFVYGHSQILQNILYEGGWLKEGIYSLGNAYFYANAEYFFENQQVRIQSSFTAENGEEYQASLEINFDSEGKLLGYSFQETMQKEGGTITYHETVSEMVYGNRLVDDQRLDLSQYFMTQYNLKEIAGEGDFTNLEKYGAESVIIKDGRTNYILPYDKTLVLQVCDYQPATVNLSLDVVTAKSSDTAQIPDVTTLGDGIFAIHALQGSNGNFLPGEATFTFTSQKGIQKEIQVIFTESELKGLTVTSAPESGQFDTIFQGGITPYFFLNTIPDEDKYSFGVEILQGPSEGISLYDFEDNNFYGYPGFSYAIQGNKVGQYQFRFYVQEATYIVSEQTYSIEVLEPYSAAYLKEQIVGKVYEIVSDTMRLEVAFLNDTTIEMTQTFSYGDTMSQTISYEIAKGALVVKDTQPFASGFYFSKISKGNIEFQRDLSKIYMLLEIYDETNEGETEHYTRMEFQEKVDKSDLASYINGKTFSTSAFVVGFANASFDITFQDGQAKLVISDYNTHEKVAEISFSYQYQKEEKKFTVQNVSSSNANWSLDVSSSAFGDYNETRSTLVLVIRYHQQSMQISFTL